MKLLLLSFSFLLFGTVAFAATKKEDFVRQYYHSAQKGDFVIAQKVLEACKECNKLEVMKEALAQAKSQKDAESSAWISSELTLAQQWHPVWYITAAGVVGLVAGYYCGFNGIGIVPSESDTEWD